MSDTFVTWSGLPFSLWDFPDPGIKPASPALEGGSFPTWSKDRQLIQGKVRFQAQVCVNMSS